MAPIADTKSFTTDYLGEVMVKLKNGGLQRAELNSRYSGQSVAPGMSVVDYLKLLKLEDVLDERADTFYLKSRKK
jgi:hypothetical protein